MDLFDFVEVEQSNSIEKIIVFCVNLVKSRCDEIWLIGYGIWQMRNSMVKSIKWNAGGMKARYPSWLLIGPILFVPVITRKDKNHRREHARDSDNYYCF